MAPEIRRGDLSLDEGRPEDFRPDPSRHKVVNKVSDFKTVPSNNAAQVTARDLTMEEGRD